MSRAAEHHRARRKIKAELKAALSGEPTGAQGMFPEGVARKNLFPMKTDANFNLNPILATNIQRSDYFRSLSSLGTFQQVVDEIYHKVSDLEPWSKVGGKTPSTAFCLLFKLCTLRPTLKQVQCMLDHKDSPFIRGIALLFVRFTCPPEDLWTWLSPYMLDEEPIGIEIGRRRKSIGDLVVMLIDSTKFLGAQMPRLPRAIETDLKVQVLKAKGEKDRLADNLRRKHEFVPGVRVKAKFSQDGEWYEAVIEERAQEDGFVLVKYTEYGNKEHVSLGAVKLAEERSRSRGRRSRSRSRSRSRRRRSRSRSRSRRRRSRSRSRSRRRRSRSGSRSRSRERWSRSGSHRRERDRDRSYRETHRSRERDARRSEDSDRRRDRDRDRSYRDRHRDRYSGDRDRDRDQERSRDRDRDTSRSYRRSGSQGDRRRFLDEENEEELKRKIAAEERRRAENRKVQSSLRNTQNGNHNKATRSTASELEKQVQMEKEQEEGVLDGPTKNTQQLDPETLARRKAELERIKQRYE